MKKDLEYKVENRVCDLLVLMADLGFESEVPEVMFDLKGKSAGQCVTHLKSGKCVLRFNSEFLDEHEEDFLENIVPHEVAHYVVFILHGRVKPHGKEWKGVMRVFGVKNPQRCHQYSNTRPTPQSPWIYRCRCRDHFFSNAMHTKAGDGVGYFCKKCKSPIRFIERGAV